MEEELEILASSSRRKKETLEETFERLCAWYLSIGMTYDDYWNGSPELVKTYREAHQYKTKAKNEELWREGYYVYIAVSTALSNGFRKKGATAQNYIEHPIPMTQLELKEQKEKEERTKLAKIMTFVKESIKVSNKKQNPKG